MKPSEYAVEILILADPEYPDGIYAWVDYDTDNKEYDRLKWVCDNEFWFKFLTVTLIHMAPKWGLNHYGCDHPNPPLEAAKIAAERFKIKILSEGITRKTGIPEDSLDPDFGYELPK